MTFRSPKTEIVWFPERLRYVLTITQAIERTEKRSRKHENWNSETRLNSTWFAPHPCVAFHIVSKGRTSPGNNEETQGLVNATDASNCATEFNRRIRDPLQAPKSFRNRRRGMPFKKALDSRPRRRRQRLWRRPSSRRWTHRIHRQRCAVVREL